MSRIRREGKHPWKNENMESVQMKDLGFSLKEEEGTEKSEDEKKKEEDTDDDCIFDDVSFDIYDPYLSDRKLVLEKKEEEKGTDDETTVRKLFICRSQNLYDITCRV